MTRSLAGPYFYMMNHPVLYFISPEVVVQQLGEFRFEKIAQRRVPILPGRFLLGRIESVREYFPSAGGYLLVTRTLPTR
jgi:hypothetical protein